MRFTDLYEKVKTTKSILTGNILPVEAYVGLIVKLHSGEWVVVTEISGKQFSGVTEGGEKQSGLKFGNDVKSIIGDIRNDFIGIGEKRHKSEVIPFIVKHVKNPGTIDEGKLENSDEIEQTLKDIDWSPLSKECSKLLGDKVNIEFKDADADNRGVYFNVGDTSNLVNKAGIFKGVVKEVYCQNFNAQYDLDENSIWLTMALAYKHHGGGSNSSTFLTAWYDIEKNKWTFKADK